MIAFKAKLTFFICPVPKASLPVWQGCEENQFASGICRIWGKQIDFQNF